VFNPIFWFYGSTATIYTADALIAILVGMFSWKTLRDERSLSLLCLAYGLSGGIRQTSLIIFFPLLFYVFWKRKPGVKEIITSILVLVLSVLVWLIPTLINTGGIENYLAISRGLSGSGAEKIQLIFGTLGAYILSNDVNLLIWLLEAINPIGLLFVLFAIGLWLKNGSIRNLVLNQKVVFFFFWVFPSLVLYSAYIEKPGYLLTIIPQFCLLIGWAIWQVFSKLSSPIRRDTLFYSCAALIVTTMFAWFIIPANKNGVPVKIERNIKLIEPPFSDYNWDVSNREIVMKEATWVEIQGLLGSDGQLTPDNTVIFWFGGYPTWRHFSYYYPAYLNIWLFDPSTSGVPGYYDYYFALDGEVGSYSGIPFYYAASETPPVKVILPEGINKIIWIGRENTDIYQAMIKSAQIDQTLRLSNDQQVVITDIDMVPLDLKSFIIQKLQE
jgi:hypothetical protein